MKQGTLSFLFFFAIILNLSAQDGLQVVKGTIIDKQSEMPLIGATVELIDTENTLGTVTDIDGTFRLEKVPVGRRAFRISYLGYEPTSLPNIVVSAGKEVILNVGLEESIETLNEVVVTAEVEKDKAQNEMATVSARTFSVEEVGRFSGGRSDVARLAGNFAGVSTANDSRNDIVIRGNSPTGVLWCLEGIPIPSPNHFATFGTTGGPVSALNPNLLRNSDFLTSAFPAEYGNALAGVFDLGMRTGNKDKHEFMVQMGAFSGLEGLAEGPISKEKNSSYVVAGRYAFTSLFAAGGAGGTSAVPNYRDIAFKVDFGTGKLGKFSLFGIGGTSDIDFLHDEIGEDDLFSVKDEDLLATSMFGVIGLRHNLLFKNNSYLRTVIAGTHAGNTFSIDRFYNLGESDEFKVRTNEGDDSENRISLSSYYNKKFNARFTLRTGLVLENFFFDLQQDGNNFGPDLDGDGINDLVTIYNFEDNAYIAQPFAQARYRINSKLTFNAGVHGQYLSLNDNFVVEPRLAFNFKVSDNQTINLGYGLHHQNSPIPIMLAEKVDANGVISLPNQDLKFTRSNQFVLGYDYKFAPNWRAKVETYYQAIDNVPVDAFASSFSALNIGADFGFPSGKTDLTNEGTGYNTGVELTVEKFFSEGFYSLITASVFDSKYTGSDEVERNTAFNNGYVLNVLGGKEWTLGKSGRTSIHLDTKLTTAGGRYFTPIDLEASQFAQTQVLKRDEAFSERYDGYFRWDVKFGFKLNSKKKKLSQQWSIDLQNVTNEQNIFNQSYNRQENAVTETYQIGFFPDFLYRLEF
jgi:hypothetical protein